MNECFSLYKENFVQNRIIYEEVIHEQQILLHIISKTSRTRMLSLQVKSLQRAYFILIQIPIGLGCFPSR